MKKLYQKRMLFYILLICLIGVGTAGYRQIVRQAKESVIKLKYGDYKAFSQGQTGKVYSADGEVLWSSDNSGFSDTFSLVGRLRDGKPIAENTITNQYKNVLVNKTGYDFLEGSSSLKGSGSDIHLTINHKWNQKIASFMQDKKVKRGTFCAMDVDTGQVLSMVSLPQVGNPNAITQEDLSKKDVLKNRNFSLMQPGSTQKIVTSILLLEEKGQGVQKDRITCKGHFITKNYDRITCSTGTGSKNLESALGTSCNCFYAWEIDQLNLQREKTVGLLKKMGYGIGVKNKNSKIGELNCARSQTPYSRTASFEDTWSLIGQYTQINPLLMCKVTSGVFNKGKSANPKILDEIITQNGEKRIKEKTTRTRICTKKSAKLMKQIWKNAFNKYYTGYNSKIKVAKTGTVEVAGQKSSNKLLIGLMKQNNRRIAFYCSIDNYKTTEILPMDVANYAASTL